MPTSTIGESSGKSETTGFDRSRGLLHHDSRPTSRIKLQELASAPTRVIPCCSEADSWADVETFDHTADLGLRMLADDLADLFQTAAIGLFDVIVANREEVRALETEQVSLQGDSTEDLLVEWLNELIYLCETRHRLYSNFQVELDETGCRLTATIGGEPIDRARHILDHEVKAATRHGLSLQKEPLMDGSPR